MKVLDKLIEKAKKRPLLAVLLFSLLLRLVYLLFDFPLWWDSHIYIGMGKYIFSSGEIGVWESFRPVIHPFVIGLFWKLGLNPVIIGKILDVILSLAVIYLTYLIAEKVFSENIAILSALVLTVTPIFIKLTGLILSEPLALSFGLLGIYLFIKNKSYLNLFIAGLLLGLAFLTKFPFGIFFLAVILILLFVNEELLLKIKKILPMVLGFTVVLAPYLFFNHYFYGDMLWAFKYSSEIAAASGWNYGSGIFYYFYKFFFLLILFFFGAAYLFFKSRQFKEKEKRLLFLIPILTLLYFVYLPTKVPRYMLVALPFMIMFSSNAVIIFYGYLKKHPSPILKPQALVVILILLALANIPDNFNMDNAAALDKEIINWVKKIEPDKIILTTNPALYSYTNNKIIIFGETNDALRIYEKETNNSDYLIINSCDLLCPPDDLICNGQKEELLERIDNENKLILRRVSIMSDKKECVQSVYEHK